MATITDGVTTLTPDLVLGWESTREARTRVHAILSREDPDVTLRPAATRSGLLRLFFTEWADAYAADQAHGGATVWTLDATTEQAGLTLTYVVSGPTSLRDEGTDRRRWLVEVAYQEVTP